VLTNREQEVVRLLLSGYSVAGLAAKMGISRGTAKNYCKSVYRKLDIGSKGELFSLFFEAGLLNEHDPDQDPLAVFDARPRLQSPPEKFALGQGSLATAACLMEAAAVGGRRSAMRAVA
jgi:DNA-binding CsgD family transcriptional regulator